MSLKRDGYVNVQYSVELIVLCINSLAYTDHIQLF